MSKASRDAAARLGDIEKAISRIRLYTIGLDADGLEASFMAFDAVLMNIQVIGEAVSKLPDSLKAVVDPAPPWTQIVAVRNVVSHGYPDVDPDVIWTIVSTRLEELEVAVDKMSRALAAD